MARKKKNSIDTFGCEIEENNNDISGFSDEPVITGTCLSSFSFDDTDNNEEVFVLSNNNSNNKPEIIPTTKITSKEISFNNTSDKPNIIEPKLNKSKNNSKSEIFDNRRTPIANGAAPQIDGETPSVRRCYILRESTIRKINELKMMDNDINVCVSTIVDLAIDYYHRNITSSNN